MSWDVFISHASEDKQDIAEPLHHLLKQAGKSVWFDQETLTLGDNLRRKIEEGLSQSRFGVVILSEKFLAKEWPKRELDGLFALEQETKRILPVWHNVERDQIVKHVPMLADRFAIDTRHGIKKVADAILRVLNCDLPSSIGAVIDPEAAIKKEHDKALGAFLTELAPPLIHPIIFGNELSRRHARDIQPQFEASSEDLRRFARSDVAYDENLVEELEGLANSFEEVGDFHLFSGTGDQFRALVAEAVQKALVLKHKLYDPYPLNRESLLKVLNDISREMPQISSRARKLMNLGKGEELYQKTRYFGGLLLRASYLLTQVEEKDISDRLFEIGEALHVADTFDTHTCDGGQGHDRIQSEIERASKELPKIISMLTQ